MLLRTFQSNFARSWRLLSNFYTTLCDGIRNGRHFLNQAEVKLKLTCVSLSHVVSFLRLALVTCIETRKKIFGDNISNIFFPFNSGDLFVR